MNEPMDMYAMKLAHKTFTEQRHRQLIFVLIQTGVNQQPLQKYSSKFQSWDSSCVCLDQQHSIYKASWLNIDISTL